ncbi:MAG: SHOCT domain-containing protein [Actinomycetes bacterium]
MPLMRRMARTAVVAGTATAVSGGVSRRQSQRFQEKDAQAEAAAAPEAAPAAAAPQADMVTQLKELAELKDQGILTEEEFAAQKAKLLAG